MTSRISPNIRDTNVVDATTAMFINRLDFMLILFCGIWGNFGEILENTTIGVIIKNPQEAFELPTAKWIPQTFNNCGPASLSMLFSYYGINKSQKELGQEFKDLRVKIQEKKVVIGAEKVLKELKAKQGFCRKKFLKSSKKMLKKRLKKT